MGRRQSCQLKPDSPPWSCPPPQEQPQPHEAEDFPWSCPWSWACAEVQPPAGVQAHEKSGELLAESGALLKESAPVLIKNGARSAARAATRAETQRPAAEKDDERRGVDMMKNIEGGEANGESFGRAPQRGKGSAERGRSARRRRGGERVFVPFHRRCASGLGCRFGLSLRAGRRCGAMSGGHCGGFPERFSQLWAGGASRRDRDAPTSEKALSPREYTANVGLSFRNRVAKCRTRLRRAVQRGGGEACFCHLD